jgi:H/ACA ribonucleoprotein complex subunit 2
MTKDKKQNISQANDTMDTSTNNPDENGATNENESTGPAYEDKFKYMNAMASPIAPKKLAKKLFKCIKQATKQKNYVRLGLRETQKYIRRGEKGLVVFAGNVTPIDIYSHMPVVCGKSISFGVHLNLYTSRILSNECLSIYDNNREYSRIMKYLSYLFLEEANIPYVFVPSKEDLGSIIRANRTCCLMMIRSHAEYKELFDEIIDKVNKLEATCGKTE